MSVAPSTRMSAAVVVGNPKLASRTSAVAVAIARRVLAHAGESGGEVSVVELAGLADKLFSWGDPDVAAAKKIVLESQLIVIASPVYKASFTGLTKAFLDQFGRDELAAAATVPVMVGASAIHHLAMESQLRPVLVEIGASCPTRGIFVLEQEIDSLDDQVSAWLAVWGNALVACPREPRPA